MTKYIKTPTFFSMGPLRKTFEILDHTADLGMLVNGEDLRDLFQNAAHAMMQIMLNLTSEPSGSISHIFVEGTDLPDLMVRWLGEILYLFEAENVLVTRTKVHEITHSHLHAQVEKSAFSLARHEILTQIKAVTYHQIQVIREEAGLWKARVIFDL